MSVDDRGGISRSRRVLVVDDNRDAALMLGELLILIGHDVRIALDGDEALAVAAWFRPELVLLDLGMPGRDGFEVAQQLRAGGAGAVIAAVTGWGDPATRSRTYAAGFDHHVTKPAALGTLRALLACVEQRVRDARGFGELELASGCAG